MADEAFTNPLYFIMFGKCKYNIPIDALVSILRNKIQKKILVLHGLGDLDQWGKVELWILPNNGIDIYVKYPDNRQLNLATLGRNVVSIKNGKIK